MTIGGEILHSTAAAIARRHTIRRNARYTLPKIKKAKSSECGTGPEWLPRYVLTALIQTSEKVPARINARISSSL
ncbi:MAG: hypothetical protein WCF90_00480 [Methanomicrobiales archaeon]